MEILSSPASIREQIVTGHYEKLPTDTGFLTHILSSPHDLNRLVADFDAGLTPLRDVGGMDEAQRSIILNGYWSGNLASIQSNNRELFSQPIANLHDRVVSGPKDQPVGHNFFVNATGFLEAGFSWAIDFDDLIRRKTSISLFDIGSSPDLDAKDKLLARITDGLDQEEERIIAVYLAGRSLVGEQYLMNHYGDVLANIKPRAIATIESIANSTGLRRDMLQRATQQILRATFGSFDHLDGLVTSDNRGAVGDYYIGSLRIEVLMDGSVRSGQLRESSDAAGIMAHEIQHASSAQEGMRCGLSAYGHGLEADEGMTEYLAQLSIGSPGIERTRDRGYIVTNKTPYRVAVLSMLSLHEQFKHGYNEHFSVLFNAYHGDIRSRGRLEQALDEFYLLDGATSSWT